MEKREFSVLPFSLFAYYLGFSLLFATGVDNFTLSMFYLWNNVKKRC